MALLLIAFALFRPGFFWDRIYPPLIESEPAQIDQVAEALPAGASIRLHAEGITIEGDEVSKTVILPLAPPARARSACSTPGSSCARRTAG